MCIYLLIGDNRVALALSNNVRKVLKDHKLSNNTPVVVVDHGSPTKIVADIRNDVTDQVEKILGNEISNISPASMERRPGDKYIFNDPLLEVALTLDGFNTGILDIIFSKKLRVNHNNTL